LRIGAFLPLHRLQRFARNLTGGDTGLLARGTEQAARNTRYVNCEAL
jgi:hypothetical protein